MGCLLIDKIARVNLPSSLREAGDQNIDIEEISPIMLEIVFIGAYVRFAVYFAIL